MKIRQSMALAVSLVLASTALTAKPHDWKTAKLVDSKTIQSDDVVGVAHPIPTPWGGGASARVQHIYYTQLRLVNDEFSFVVQCVGYPGHFILGDEVKFYVDKAILHVMGADGKERRFGILRQERLSSQ